jgi:hypothetical protein
MRVEHKKSGNILDVTPEQWETLKAIEGRNWRVIKGATVEELTRSKARPDVSMPLEVQNIIKHGRPAPLIEETQDEQIKHKQRKKKTE